MLMPSLRLSALPGQDIEQGPAALVPLLFTYKKSWPKLL